MATEIPESVERQEQDSSTILRIVPYNEAFHFNTEDNVYTGTSAESLEDFASKLKTIDVKSVTFHYYRGDFQRWIENILGDTDFANQLCFIRTGISGEQLRQELLKRLERRITELRGLKWVETEGI